MKKRGEAKPAGSSAILIGQTKSNEEASKWRWGD